MNTPEYERERCALLADSLAERWEASAKRMRVEGSYRGGWPWNRSWFVLPGFEKAAKDMEAAAHGLRTVARGCREGWDTRK